MPSVIVNYFLNLLSEVNKDGILCNLFAKLIFSVFINYYVIKNNSICKIFINFNKYYLQELQGI